MVLHKAIKLRLNQSFAQGPALRIHVHKDNSIPRIATILGIVVVSYKPVISWRIPIMSDRPQQQQRLKSSAGLQKGMNEDEDEDRGSSRQNLQTEDANTVGSTSRETDPSADSSDNEDLYRIRYPPPPTISRAANGLRYKLETVQQPQRARMCGYGDKDRRPISSPPIFRLKIIDDESGNEINYDQDTRIAYSQFVAIVRIYNLQGTEDATIVRSAHSNGCVSQTQAIPFTPLPMPQLNRFERAHVAALQSSTRSTETSTNMPPGSAFTLPGASPNGRSILNAGPDQYHQIPPQYAIQPSPYANGGPPQSPPGTAPHDRNGSYTSHSQHPQPPPTPPADTSGVAYTRNLIGCTATSGLKLIDTNQQAGIFFIFNDISVRTESWFRLKCEVFDLGDDKDTWSPMTVAAIAKVNGWSLDYCKERLRAHSQKKPSTGSASQDEIKIRQTYPCLAETFTACFKVYSAKKFPGVTDSTEISKCFAKQGVKISIRKDGDRASASKAKASKRKRSDGGSEAVLSDSE